MKLPSSKNPVFLSTNLWCCDELKEFSKDAQFSYRGMHIYYETKWEYDEILICKYCPFCGEKFDDQELQLEIYQKTIIKPDSRLYREYCILPEYINNENINNEIRQQLMGERI